MNDVMYFLSGVSVGIVVGILLALYIWDNRPAVKPAVKPRGYEPVPSETRPETVVFKELTDNVWAVVTSVPAWVIGGAVGVSRVDPSTQLKHHFYVTFDPRYNSLIVKVNIRVAVERYIAGYR